MTDINKLEELAKAAIRIGVNLDDVHRILPISQYRRMEEALRGC